MGENLSKKAINYKNTVSINKREIKTVKCLKSVFEIKICQDTVY